MHFVDLIRENPRIRVERLQGKLGLFPLLQLRLAPDGVGGSPHSLGKKERLLELDLDQQCCFILTLAKGV